MQNTDKELLELAAKAAGYCNWTFRGHGLFIETGHSRGDSGFYWNPLDDDGAALRLVVKLGISVQHSAMFDTLEPSIETFDSEDRFDGWFEQPKGNDPYAATRRAIVRAAAEIGRNMK